MEGIIVVEGKTDKDFLSQFLDVEIITTNGSAISGGVLDYLKEASKSKSIIVMTDPDYPGSKIRKTINEAIPNSMNAFLPKEMCIKRGKVGVAESDKQTVLDALNNLIPQSSAKESNLTYDDLYSLGYIGNDDSSTKRKQLENKYHLGHTNGKSLLARLRALGVNKEDLEKNDD